MDWSSIRSSIESDSVFVYKCHSHFVRASAKATLTRIVTLYGWYYYKCVVFISVMQRGLGDANTLEPNGNTWNRYADADEGCSCSGYVAVACAFWLTRSRGAFWFVLVDVWADERVLTSTQSSLLHSLFWRLLNFPHFHSTAVNADIYGCFRQTSVFAQLTVMM